MVRRDTPRAYDGIARSFHWLTALLVAFLFGLGTYMTGLDYSDWKVSILSWHAGIGLTVFALTGLRLAWRLLNPPPPMPPSAWIEQIAAHATHGFLYFLMFAMPLLGYFGSNASGYPVRWFGLVELPDPIGKNEALGEDLLLVHVILAWMMAATLALHMGAALFHHFVRRDPILGRMLPGVKPRRSD
jgi:cytochrome b561